MIVKLTRSAEGFALSPQGLNHLNYTVHYVLSTSGLKVQEWPALISLISVVSTRPIHANQRFLAEELRALGDTPSASLRRDPCAVRWRPDCVRQSEAAERSITISLIYANQRFLAEELRALGDNPSAS